MFQQNITLKHHLTIFEVTPPEDSIVLRALSQRLDGPETTSPEGSTISKSIPLVPSKTDATTDSLDHWLHLWRALCRQLIHISNV